MEMEAPSSKKMKLDGEDQNLSSGPAASTSSALVSGSGSQAQPYGSIHNVANCPMYLLQRSEKKVGFHSLPVS